MGTITAYLSREIEDEMMEIVEKDYLGSISHFIQDAVEQYLGGKQHGKTKRK